MKLVIEVRAGDIVIAQDDFALMLDVSNDGWPVEWMWLASGNHALTADVGRHALRYLFEGRAVLRPDGQVLLCPEDRTSPGWNPQALAWWREAELEAFRASR